MRRGDVARAAVGESGRSAEAAVKNDQRPYKRRWQFKPFTIGIALDKLYLPSYWSTRTTSRDVTCPHALFESPRDKYTNFVSRICPRAEALGQILKTNWCICPRSIQNRACTLSKDCIIALYTDDCLIFSDNDKTIDDLCESLSEDFLLKDEGDIEDFLGIRITKSVSTADGSVTFTMTQPGLIDQILEDVGLINKDSDGASPPHGKFTPANGHVHPNPDAMPFSAQWNYRSIIGKLNFLAQNTRPDISYAVHACARFVNKPNQKHQEAVKYLCRYLLLTQKRGLILSPIADNRLNAYVDSDFCGLWSTQTSNLRESALSRTGYVITYCGCPIHWVSKLQSEIALSTTESEYIALSMCMRDLIPMRTLLSEISSGFQIAGLAQNALLDSGPVRAFSRMFESTVYEDNMGCLEIASNPEQYRPRTKHIGIKWHHFRDQIAAGHVKIEKIDTKFNWADIFTKPLPRPQFEALRKLMMGW